MEKVNKPFKFRVGMRNVKTAIAATLIAIVYVLFLPWRNPTFACIGAIFGTGSDMDDSWLNGGNRLFGTIIGGFIGIALYRLYLFAVPTGEISMLMMPFLFVGVVLLIIACQFFRWPGGIQPGGVVLCIIMFSQNRPETYLWYSLDRMFDTAIGVIVALLINLLFPRDRILKIMCKLRLRKAPEEE